MIIQDLNYLEAVDNASRIAGEGYKHYSPKPKKDDCKPEPKKHDKKKDDCKPEKEYEKYVCYYPKLKKYLH